MKKRIAISMLLSFIAVFLFFLSVDNNTQEVYATDNFSTVTLSDTSGYRYFTAEDINKNFGSNFESYILLDLHYQNTFNDIVFNLSNGYILKLSSELKFSESCSECDAPPLYYYLCIYNNNNLISKLTYKYYPSSCCGNNYYYNNYNAIYINNINISSISSGNILNDVYKYGIKIKDKAVPKYDVTINANGGTGSYTFTDVTEITSADLNTIKQNITRDGYYIKALNVNSTGLGVDINYPYTVTSDVTLYCIWEHSNYQITIDLNGGNVIPGLSASLSFVSTGISYIGFWESLAPKIQKQGYTIKGISLTSDGAALLDLDDEGDVIYATQDTTYYVIWQPITYLVHIDSFGLDRYTIDTNQITSEHVAAYNAARTKTGCTCIGFSETIDGEPVTLPYDVTTTRIIFAVWNSQNITLKNYILDDITKENLNDNELEYGPGYVIQESDLSSYISKPSGYSNTKWYADIDLMVEIQFPYTVSGNDIFYSYTYKNGEAGVTGLSGSNLRRISIIDCPLYSYNQEDFSNVRTFKFQKNTPIIFYWDYSYGLAPVSYYLNTEKIKYDYGYEPVFMDKNNNWRNPSFLYGDPENITIYYENYDNLRLIWNKDYQIHLDNRVNKPYISDYGDWFFTYKTTEKIEDPTYISNKKDNVIEGIGSDIIEKAGNSIVKSLFDNFQNLTIFKLFGAIAVLIFIYFAVKFILWIINIFIKVYPTNKQYIMQKDKLKWEDAREKRKDEKDKMKQIEKETKKKEKTPKKTTKTKETKKTTKTKETEKATKTKETKKTTKKK